MSGPDLHAPWRAAAATQPEQWPLQVLDAQGQAVCFIAHSNGQNPAADWAKAELAAAAPQLLEALRDAIDAVKVFHGPDAWDIYWQHSPECKRWRDAIAKATRGAA